MKKRVFFILLGLCLLASCNDNDYYDLCENPIILSQGELQRFGESVKAMRAFLAPRKSRWENPNIKVCWEDDTFLEEQEADRKEVEKWIGLTWTAVLDVPAIPAEKRVRFTGWKKCSQDPDTAAHGVRIRVSDTPSDNQPWTKVLGKRLAGRKNGVTLNFGFKNFSIKQCSSSDYWRLQCLHASAAHEFGHVLGMGHEHARRDAPASCKMLYPDLTDEDRAFDGDLYEGDYDEDSIMNYCSYNLVTVPSQNDRWGIIAFYYSELANTLCGKTPAPPQITSTESMKRVDPKDGPRPRSSQSGADGAKVVR